jgi:ATP-binding cassette subfamily F protein 3
MMQREYNLLIMDEPTNHMDIGSREILEEALLGYSGTCLFISHDRFFIDKTSTAKYLLTDGKLLNYTGDYSVLLGKNRENDTIEDMSSGKNERTEKLSKNRVIEIKKTETEIHNTEKVISEIEEEMSGNLPLEKLESLYIRKKNLSELLDGLYEQWDSLNKP